MEPASLPPPDPWAITLAAAMPRHPGIFDHIVNQATQLGVAAIVPLVTARSVVRLEAARADARHRRWTQLAIAAAQQSGRGTVPAIAPVTMFAEALRQHPAFDRLLVPTLGADLPSLASVLGPPVPHRILLLIGPEGDFTSEEVAQASGVGAHPISLGPWVLRCETAVVAALAMLQDTLRIAHQK